MPFKQIKATINPYTGDYHIWDPNTDKHYVISSTSFNNGADIIDLIPDLQYMRDAYQSSSSVFEEKEEIETIDESNVCPSSNLTEKSIFMNSNTVKWGGDCLTSELVMEDLQTRQQYRFKSKTFKDVKNKKLDDYILSLHPELRYLEHTNVPSKLSN